MTLKEIAAEAGVSVSTVSRVINKSGKSPASPEVQERIWKIVRRTGYLPDMAARRLKMGVKDLPEAARSIACLYARVQDSDSDTFFTVLARSIEREAFKHGYILKYTFTAPNIRHPDVLRLIAGSQAQGVAVLGRCDIQLLKFLKQQFPYVACAGLNPLEAKYDQIICDGYQAAVTAVDHLIKLGHRRIAYVGETRDENRYLGYCRALSAARIPLCREAVINVPLSRPGGYRGANLVFDRAVPVTALFCPNDATAIGAMKAAKERDISIPGDLSVISIDDIDTAQYLTPMLTTIHIPVEEMGQMTAKLLIDRMEGGHTLPMKVSLPFYLAGRESCGSCPVPAKEKP
ncbi:MAG: LacI family transcriptional regulator [Hungatella sp.]|jgi:DNA-binding LacI/PurR family transcriptional regulator|nr:LacI family transcriptional regulator [Hungatella sp.]